jgi:hypothetical protein
MTMLYCTTAKKLYKFDSDAEYKISMVVMESPRIQTVCAVSSDLIFGCADGMYILSYSNPTGKPEKFSQDVKDVVEENANITFGDNIALASRTYYGKYWLSGYRLRYFNPLISRTLLLPKVYNYEPLPEDTNCVGFVRIDDRRYLYAFTSEGIYRSGAMFLTFE